MTTSFDRDLARGSAETLRVTRQQLSALEIPLGRGWSPEQAAMAAVVRDPPSGIAGVIAKLEEIQRIIDRLPPSRAKNRMSMFNRLYTKITKRVAGALRQAQQPEFLELLDVEFAKRYFSALDLWNHDDDATPDVWEVLFKRAADMGLSRLGAAILGVNAHINHDLSLALIATWNELGPPEDDRIHPDYLVVNQIFYEEIPILKRVFSDRWQQELDELVGPLDDWSEKILVRVTRAEAWDQARRLWPLREDPTDFEDARRTMDRAASLLGEWLIVTDRLVNDGGKLTGFARRLLRRILAWVRGLGRGGGRGRGPGRRRAALDAGRRAA